MDMDDLHKRIGAAIQRAAADLPKGYEITIELEQGSGTVALWTPPISDEEGGRRLINFVGGDFAEDIEGAIALANEHAAETGA